MTTELMGTAQRAMALLHEVAEATGAEQPFEELVQRAVTIAPEMVPGCEQAGVSFLEKGSIETAASFGDLAAQCDKAQEQLEEGPCVSALLDADLVRVDDMTVDDRWPAFAKEAAGLGVRSMLGLRLPTRRDQVGALNLYSTQLYAFDEASVHAAVTYSAHVGFIFSAQERERNLREGLKTRETIGQAIGILMERHRLSAGQGFDLLVLVSQRTHIKLRDLAEELVRTGALPQTT